MINEFIAFGEHADAVVEEHASVAAGLDNVDFLVTAAFGKKGFGNPEAHLDNFLVDFIGPKLQAAVVFVHGTQSV
jgi:hypothetical protein